MLSKYAIIAIIFGSIVLSGCSTFATTEDSTAPIALTMPVSSTTTVTADADITPTPAVAATNAQYLTSTSTDVSAVHGTSPYVLFFHADWGPTCRALEKDIKAELSTFPEGTQILKVNYDNEKKLKSRHKITTQSTVLVFDADGIEVFRKLDPSIEELKTEITKSINLE